MTLTYNPLRSLSFAELRQMVKSNNLVHASAAGQELERRYEYSSAADAPDVFDTMTLADIRKRAQAAECPIERFGFLRAEALRMAATSRPPGGLALPLATFLFQQLGCRN